MTLAVYPAALPQALELLAGVGKDAEHPALPPCCAGWVPRSLAHDPEAWQEHLGQLAHGVRRRLERAGVQKGHRGLACGQRVCGVVTAAAGVAQLSIGELLPALCTQISV